MLTARRLLTTLLLALLAAAPLSAQRGGAGAPPPKVLVEPAAIRRHADELEALGTLRANESVTITAPVTERIAQLHFQDGQTVAAGDLLVTLENAEEAAGLSEAKSNLAEAKRQLERIRPLAESGTATQAALDQALRDFEIAAARVEALESRLADRFVRAPFAGRVGLREASPGALVTAGQRITTLDDLTSMKLDFSVPSDYLVALREDGAVVGRARALDNRPYEGRITSIDTRVDPVTRSVVVRAQLPNPGGELRPGLLLAVRILKAEREAVFVPESALLQFGRTTYVFVVEGEGAEIVAKRRQVKLGSRVPGAAEIVEGVKAGERVVAEGAFNLRPNQKVSLQTRAAMGQAAPGQ